MPITELPGTLQSPKVGSFTASKVYSGSFSKNRFYQVMGTHLNGSIAALTTITRYAVWPVAFPNASYQGVVTLGVRGGADLANLYAGLLTKVAGSMQYGVANTATLANAPPGTVYLMGLAP